MPPVVSGESTIPVVLVAGGPGRMTALVSANVTDTRPLDFHSLMVEKLFLRGTPPLKYRNPTPKI